MMLLSLPFQAEANTAIEIIDNDFQSASITYNPATLKLLVKGAQNQKMYIYNVTGICVMAVKVEGQECSYELKNLPKGCYIVKIGKLVRKISVKGSN